MLLKLTVTLFLVGAILLILSFSRNKGVELFSTNMAFFFIICAILTGVAMIWYM